MVCYRVLLLVYYATNTSNSKQSQKLILVKVMWNVILRIDIWPAVTMNVHKVYELSDVIT